MLYFTVILPPLTDISLSFAEDIGLDRFNVRMNEYRKGEINDLVEVAAPTWDEVAAWLEYVSTLERRD